MVRYTTKQGDLATLRGQGKRQKNTSLVSSLTFSQVEGFNYEYGFQVMSAALTSSLDVY